MNMNGLMPFQTDYDDEQSILLHQKQLLLSNTTDIQHSRNIKNKNIVQLLSPCAHIRLIRLMLVTSALAVCSFQSYAMPGAQGKKPIAATAVGVESVESYAIAQNLALVGKLEAKTSVEIKPEVTGKVDNIAVQSNQKVNKGDVLITLERYQEQAAVAEAQAYLNDENRKANEYIRLGAKNAISKTELEAQKASAVIAKARLDVAQANLSDMTIKAPFSGTIGLIDLSQGKMLSSGDSLFTLDDLSIMRLDLQVPERYLSQLKLGMKVETKSQAWGEQVFTGEVTGIATRVDTSSLSVATRLEIKNTQDMLKPGMLMTARLVFPEIQAPIIPIQALEYSGTKRYVYVVGDDLKVKRTLIEVGTRVGEKIVVTKGLNVDQTIVTSGLVNMRDGLSVKITERYDPKTGERIDQDADGSQLTPKKDQ